MKDIFIVGPQGSGKTSAAQELIAQHFRDNEVLIMHCHTITFDEVNSPDDMLARMRNERAGAILFDGIMRSEGDLNAAQQAVWAYRTECDFDVLAVYTMQGDPIGGKILTKVSEIEKPHVGAQDKVRFMSSKEIQILKELVKEKVLMRKPYHNTRNKHLKIISCYESISGDDPYTVIQNACEFGVANAAEGQRQKANRKADGVTEPLDKIVFKTRDQIEDDQIKAISEGLERSRPLFASSETKPTSECLICGYIQEMTDEEIIAVHKQGRANFDKAHELKFKTVVEPVIQYLAEKHHPHTSIVITNNRAELKEDIKAHHTNAYLKD